MLLCFFATWFFARFYLLSLLIKCSLIQHPFFRNFVYTPDCLHKQTLDGNKHRLEIIAAVDTSSFIDEAVSSGDCCFRAICYWPSSRRCEARYPLEKFPTALPDEEVAETPNKESPHLVVERKLLLFQVPRAESRKQPRRGGPWGKVSIRTQQRHPVLGTCSSRAPPIRSSGQTFPRMNPRLYRTTFMSAFISKVCPRGPCCWRRMLHLCSPLSSFKCMDYG